MYGQVPVLASSQNELYFKCILTVFCTEYILYKVIYSLMDVLIFIILFSHGFLLSVCWSFQVIFFFLLDV
jgi:hypothetical protein